MAMFTFPLSFEQFKNSVRDEKKFESVGDLEFVYSCLRMGWMNKQHHKSKQMRDQEMLRLIRDKQKTDPSFAAKLKEIEGKKGL